MLKKLLSRLRARRQQRADLRRLRDFSSVFASLTKLERSGLLAWEAKSRRLFIAQPLAIVMLAQGFDCWQNFLNNVFLYLSYKLQQQQWHDYILDEQAKAVRQRKKEVVVLTKAETERTRRAVADRINSSDISLPPIEAFEFFILTDSADDQAKAQIIWVGEYNPDTGALDMAEWDTIKHALEQQKSND